MIQASPAYLNGGVLFVTWDEADGGDGPIPFLNDVFRAFHDVVVSPQLRKRLTHCLPLGEAGTDHREAERKRRRVSAEKGPRSAERRLRIAPVPAPPGVPEPLEDDALIDAVANGDARLAGDLYDRLIHVIEGTLYRLLGSQCDWDDLVQVTFEQVVLSLVRRRFSRACSLSTWTSSVAAHVAFNFMRSRRRANRVFDRRVLASSIERRASHDPEREIGVREQIGVVRAQMAVMNPGRAMVLVLHDVLGHELVDTARILGISVTAAQSRLVRGRRELLRKLGDGDEPK
ncbi:MAG: RNA polymerase sigma factor [Myxococcota bacterium]|nr:RNA polymerase sigma factor [Myxococcota bacterium]